MIDRFDSDGNIVTDSWLPVANFTWDMDTNKSGLEINGQDVMALFESIDADVLAVQNGLGAKMNSVNSFYKSLSGDNVILTLDDKIQLVGDQESFAIQRFDNDGAIATNTFLDVAKFTYNTETNQAAMIMNGVDIFNEATTAAPQTTTYTKTEVDELLNSKEPIFTAIEPLQKVINFPDGTFSIALDSSGIIPFFCAGKVDGSNLAKLTSKGIAYTVTREPDFATGVFNINFAEAHPDGVDYIILVTTVFSLHYLTGEVYSSTTANSFTITLKTTSNDTLTDGVFHFMVLN
jgi:hypothetical protein